VRATHGDRASLARAARSDRRLGPEGDRYREDLEFWEDPRVPRGDYCWMVALTCRNPECALPRTRIVLRNKEFLTPAEDADAAGQRRRRDGAG
jgi:hypothetical protein